MKSETKKADFPVLFEDEWCIAVAKPSGLLTQAPAGIDSMEARIRRYLQTSEEQNEPYLGVPHRLDRPASGAMIFAKTRKAAQRLAEQFQKRTVQKTYWALVEGNVQPAEGCWIDFMHKVEGEPRAELVHEGHSEAQHAELRYVKRGECAASTWLEIELITGRTHQIRLQAGSRGHPILGDVLYGSQRPFGVHFEDARLNAIALHARSLRVEHPKTYELMLIEAPMAAGWEGYISSESLKTINSLFNRS